MKFIIAATTCTFLFYATFNYNEAVTFRNAEAMLPGIYGPDSASKHIIDLASIDNNATSTIANSISVTMLDARAKEREEGLSKRDFFNKHGFVILDHKSAMSAKDWSASDRDVSIIDLFKEDFYDFGDQYNKVMDGYRNADTPAKNIYAKEVEDLIRSLFPQTKEVMAPAEGTQRTVASNNSKPVKTLHTDYGAGYGFDGLINNIKYIDFHSHQEKYQETGADEFMLVNFWRPVTMSQKLRSNPLCFVDSSTVNIKDQVTVELVKENKTVGNIYTLKENLRHAFYFYPDMTNDEVVVFKQFHQVRNESTTRMPTFHTAFVDPAADEKTEGRTSFEYRVAILF